MAIKYKWLAGQLEIIIENNIKNGIPKLPTEHELCKKYRLSRQTVRMSLDLLEQKGLIRRKQGSGAFITGRIPGSRGNVISVLISSDQEYIYPGVLGDIRTTLAEHGFEDEVFVTGNCIARERSILLKLLQKPPRGMIVEGCKSALPNPNLDLFRALEKKNCQIVFLFNCYPELAGCISIKDDNYYGSAMLVEHLHAQGHTAIGAIFKADDMQGIERYQGFIETVRDLSLSMYSGQVCWYDSGDLDLLYLKKNTFFLREMIRKHLATCTAVICYNDLIAYYLVEELHLSGYRLPDDMAVAAFDNTYLSNSDILAVTTLSHQPHEMGTKAAATLIHKLSGLPALAQETRWTLNIKESTLIDR